MNSFWTRVREGIIRQGLSQRAISSELGIREDSFSRWMSRGVMPRADQVEQIARLIKVSTAYLVTGEKKPTAALTLFNFDGWISSNTELVKDLMELDPDQLALIRPMITAAAVEARRRRQSISGS